MTESDTVTPAGRPSSYGLHDTAGPTTHLPGGGMQSGSGKIYALTDRLGSTRATTTAQGVVSERVRYDAWGRITAQTGAVPVGTPLYAGAWGYEREPEGVTGLGLDYLTHRYYDPQIGRFISRDPIRWDGGLNLYGYCENDPVNSVDPSGLSPGDALGVLGVGISVGEAVANPTPGNIGMAALDVITELIPVIPGTSVRHFGKAVKALPSGQVPKALPPGPIRKALPARCPEPYGHLPQVSPPRPGGRVTPAQKKAIYDENRRMNGGQLASDASSAPVIVSGKSAKGVTPRPDEAQIDHVVPRSKGGSNAMENLQVLSRAENRRKSNK